jgi:hypothetical protein
MIAPGKKDSSKARGSLELTWFLAWVAVGVGLALAVSTLGFYATPLACLAAIALLLRHHGGRAAFGALVGMGMLALYVAYVQRAGPGTVSWHTATSSGATQYLDPRPWLVVGLVLVGSGLGATFWRRRIA